MGEDTQSPMGDDTQSPMGEDTQRPMGEDTEGKAPRGGGGYNLGAP